MIFAFVSLRAGTVGGLPNRNPKRLFSRTSNEISKKAVRFSSEVGRCRKAPRHQLFRNFSQKQSKYPVNSSMAGAFRFSYLLIKYRKVSGSDGTRNQFASNRTRVRIPPSPPKALENTTFSRAFTLSWWCPLFVNGALGALICGALGVLLYSVYSSKMNTVVPLWCPNVLKTYKK